MSTAMASGSLAARAVSELVIAPTPPRAFHMAVISAALRLAKSTLKPSSTQIDCRSRPAARRPKASSSKPRSGARTLPLQLVAGAARIAVEHGDRLRRVGGQVLADQLQFVEQVGSHGDDVAARGLGLEEVQQLTRAGPQQLDPRVRLQQAGGVGD